MHAAVAPASAGAKAGRHASRGPPRPPRGAPRPGPAQPGIRSGQARQAQREQRARRGHAPRKTDVADDHQRQQAAQEHRTARGLGLRFGRLADQRPPGCREQVGRQRYQEQPAHQPVLGQQLQEFVVDVVVGFELRAFVLVQRDVAFPGAGADAGQRTPLDHADCRLPHHHADAQRRVAGRNRSGALEAAFQGRQASPFLGDLRVAGGDEAQARNRAQQQADGEHAGASAPAHPAELRAIEPCDQRQHQQQLQPQGDQRTAGARHQHRDDHQPRGDGEQRYLRALPRPGQQQRRERQRAHRELGEEVAVDEGGSRVRALGEEPEFDPELQCRPQRSHHGAGMDAPRQHGQAVPRQAVDAHPEQQGKDEPADGLDRGQVSVRPGHAAQGISQQQQGQPHHSVPAQRVPPFALAPEEQQGRAEDGERHDDGLQGVLEHLLIGHAERRREEHHQR